MRILAAALLSLLTSTLSLAAELQVRVVDPHSAAVAGARVALYAQGADVPLASKLTSGAGVAVFTVPPGGHRLEVLAPGFARLTATLTGEQAQSMTLQLTPAPVAETVLVSAARSPLPVEAAGAPITFLDPGQLAAQQPVAAAEALRYLPGAVLSVAGRRGGQASLFVRGGDSRYNKVIVDDVVINSPGGTFDFGVVPVTEVERIEFLRGAHSTLYGSDAMTSVVQVWTRSGSTRVPELRFGADGGTFATARGYASVAGARGRVDYNLFGEQFNTSGQGINDAYSNSAFGGNLGVMLSDAAFFRLRARHANSRSGVQSFWNFNGQPLLPPESETRARQRNFLASADLTLTAPARWQHRFTAFEYNHRRTVVNEEMEPGRDSPIFGPFDFPFHDFANLNRAGGEYQGEYAARSWTRTVFGYHFENLNGFVGDRVFNVSSHGLRRNHALYAQQVVHGERGSLTAGLRFVRNQSFGSKAVPRVAATYALLRSGGAVFSGTRLRAAYATGIKEPRLEEEFGIGGFGIIPNPNLKAEEARSLEAGFMQNLFGGRYSLHANYFHNTFRDQVAFRFDPVTFESQYVNLNRALAHGAEVELHGRLPRNISLMASYMHTSTQILQAPTAFDPLLAEGAPLLRRPRHAGSLLLNYSRARWGGMLGGTFLGRRPDSDFIGLLPPVTYAAGYARFDVGGWYALNRYATIYANLENLADRKYEEAAGYPALGRNVRVGMRFRVGGE